MRPIFSPTEFIAKSDALGGLAKTWKYGVQIIPPSGMSNSAADNIEFLAASATFPGKSFGTTEHRTYGITRTLPYEQTYYPDINEIKNPIIRECLKFLEIDDD